MRLDHVQIVDMNMQWMADSNFTTMFEPPMTGGLGVLVVLVHVNVGAFDVGWVVVGNSGHGHPTFMVRMTKSDYWVVCRSTRAGIPRLANRKWSSYRQVIYIEMYIPFQAGNGRASP